MQTGVLLNYDLDDTPLEIKSSTSVGGRRIDVHFFTDGNDYAGAISIITQSTPTYYIYFCSSHYSASPASQPSANFEIWRITLTKTSGVRLVVQCNEVEVINILMSSSTCSGSYSGDTWTKDVNRISFSNVDTASYFYRKRIPGNLKL